MKIQNYINGNFHNPIDDEWLDNYNPSNGEVYGQLPNSSKEDVENAYIAAKSAFPTWSQTTLEERSRILIKISELLESNLQRFAEADGFEEAHQIVMGRCSMCHAREPFWDGIRWAPKGVFLETPADIAKNASAIYLQAGVSHAMPPANITGIAPEERQQLAAWFKAGES